MLEFTNGGLDALEEKIAARFGNIIGCTRVGLYVLPLTKEQASVLMAGDATDALGARR